VQKGRMFAGFRRRGMNFSECELNDNKLMNYSSKCWKMEVYIFCRYEINIKQYSTVTFLYISIAKPNMCTNVSDYVILE